MVHDRWSIDSSYPAPLTMAITMEGVYQNSPAGGCCNTLEDNYQLGRENGLGHADIPRFAAKPPSQTCGLKVIVWVACCVVWLVLGIQSIFSTLQQNQQMCGPQDSRGRAINVHPSDLVGWLQLLDIRVPQIDLSEL